MRRLGRAPLTWMVIAEVAVVGALIAVAWHALAGATSSSTAAPFLFPSVAASPADTALPGAGVPVAAGSTRGPAPGLNLGIEFWRLRLRRPHEREAAGWRAGA